MQEEQNINVQIENAEDIQKKNLNDILVKNCQQIVNNINMNSAYFNIFLLLVLLISAANISYIIVLVFLWIFDLQEIYNQVKFHKSIQYMDNNFDQYLLNEIFIKYILYYPLYLISLFLKIQYSKAGVKKQIKIEIFDCIIGFAFKMSILLFFEKQSSTLAIPSIVAFSYFGFRILSNLICRGKKKEEISQQEAEFSESLQILQAQKQTNSFYFIINNWIFRIYCVSQAIFYSLKLEGYISWSWSEVFWIYWVFFCIIIGITLIIFLLLVVKICDFCGGAKNELVEIQGLFWFFLIMSFISANSSYSVLMYTDVLTEFDFVNDTENKDVNEIRQDKESLESAESALLPIIYQVAGGFVAQLLYFFVFRSQISQNKYSIFDIAFVKLIMFEYSEQDGEEEQQPNQQRNNQSNPPQNPQSSRNPPKKVRMAYKSKLVLEEKEVAPAMNLPQFVSKVSSTYFKFLMNKKEVQTEMTEKKSKAKVKKQQTKQAVKDPSPPNGNSTKNKRSVGRGSTIRSRNIIQHFNLKLQ